MDRETIWKLLLRTVARCEGVWGRGGVAPPEFLTSVLGGGVSCGNVSLELVWTKRRSRSG
jgi:hypothetical protein